MIQTPLQSLVELWSKLGSREAIATDPELHRAVVGVSLAPTLNLDVIFGLLRFRT